MPDNIQAGISIKKHRTFKDRLAAAQTCCTSLNMQIPLLIDGIDDAVGTKYSGHPDRLYIIDRDGKVAYKGGRGPFGFIPGQLEQCLTMLMIEQEMPDPEETEVTGNKKPATSTGDELED